MEEDPHLTRSLGFLLADVSRLLRRRLDARAARLDLTRAQWRVLAQLRRQEGLKQTEIAERLEIEPITLVRHLDRLVAKGLIERRADPNDRRAWRIFLCAEVQPVLDQMRAYSKETREEALAGIPADQHELLIDLLLKMKDNMNAFGRDESLEMTEVPVTKIKSGKRVSSRGR